MNAVFLHTFFLHLCTHTKPSVSQNRKWVGFVAIFCFWRIFLDYWHCHSAPPSNSSWFAEVTSNGKRLSLGDGLKNPLNGLILGKHWVAGLPKSRLAWCWSEMACGVWKPWKQVGGEKWTFTSKCVEVHVPNVSPFSCIVSVFLGKVKQVDCRERAVSLWFQGIWESVSLWVLPYFCIAPLLLAPLTLGDKALVFRRSSWSLWKRIFLSV